MARRLSIAIAFQANPSSVWNDRQDVRVQFPVVSTTQNRALLLIIQS
jgi:hypothetical protein